jgi:phosphatidylserine/phosphatidylglycerophosphate/cardiolipin synthase-like enzyme
MPRSTDHHGKLYLVDHAVAIITSADTTGRGFIEQIESGSVVTDPVEVARLADEFDGTSQVRMASRPSSSSCWSSDASTRRSSSSSISRVILTVIY